MNNGASSTTDTITQLQTLIRQVERSEGDFSDVVAQLQSAQQRTQNEMALCRQQIQQYQNDLKQVRQTHQEEWRAAQRQTERDTSAHLSNVEKAQGEQHLRMQKQYDALVARLQEALAKGQTSADAIDSTVRRLTDDWQQFQKRSEKEFSDCLLTLPHFAQVAAQEASETVWGQVNTDLSHFADRSELHGKRLNDLEKQQISIMGHLNTISRDLLRLKQEVLTTHELADRTVAVVNAQAERSKERHDAVQAEMQELKAAVSDLQRSWWSKVASKGKRAADKAPKQRES